MWFGVVNTALAWLGALSYFFTARGPWGLSGGGALILLGLVGLVLAFLGVIVGLVWWGTGSGGDPKRACLAHALAFLALPAFLLLVASGYVVSV
jgi:hypothetical protein